MRRLFIRHSSFLVAFILGVALWLPFFNRCVVATELPTLMIDGSTGVSDFQRKANSVSKKVGGFSYISHKSGEGNTTIISVNTIDYNSLTSSEKRELMIGVLDAVENSNLQTKEKTRVYNFICKQDTTVSAVTRQLSNNVTADYVQAWVWFKPFSGGISTFLGFITLAISALLTLSTLIDIAWLVIPLFQVATIGTDGSKPKFISNEAWTAHKDSEGNSNVYRDAMLLYFGRRVKKWLILFVCLLYLLNGQIFDLIGWIMDTLSTILFD